MDNAPILDTLLTREGPSYAEELAIDLSTCDPDALFRWLCASLLFSARIKAVIALRAAKALFRRGWVSPRAMAESTWDERVSILNQAGYGRYDESTARMLGEAAQMTLDLYGGDLNNLRRDAHHSPARIRKALRRYRGIGEVGADIFCRQAQLCWDELFPFLDGRAQRAALQLGLPEQAADLAELVSREDFVRLVDALARVDIAHSYEAVRHSTG